MKAGGGITLALAKAADITPLEGAWPGGIIGLWQIDNITLARQAISVVGSWNNNSFAVMTRQREGASYPKAAAGFLLVQGIFTDPVKAVAYNMALPQIYKKFGGFYLSLARVEDVTHLAGMWKPKAIVIAIFDSVEAAKAFWYSDEYKTAKILREGGGEFLVAAFSGV